MSVIKPRYWPRMKLYRRNRSANPAMLRDIITGAIEVQTVVEPAKRSAIAITKLKDGVNAVTLDYQQRWQPTTINMFHRFPSPEEMLYRQNSQALVQQQLDTEQAKDADKQDADLIHSLEATIDQLKSGGSGYLEQAQNTMGTNTKALFWSLAGPNVPVILESTFTLDKNRTFSLRFHRSQKPKGQGDDFNLTFEFGNGFTLYAIIIGSDGNKSTFLHYRNMTPKARKVLLDQRDDLLDNARLTPADMAKILDLQSQAAAIKNAAKKSGVKLSDEDNTKLKQISDAEKTLRDSKKSLTAKQQDGLSDLENKLYLKQQPFRLQEESQDLIDKTIDLTVQFLRGGYVTIQSGDSTFIYENQRLTGARPHGYHDGLPAGSSIHVKSDGGQFAFIYGNPNYATKAVIASQQFALNYAPVIANLNVESDADSSADNVDITYELKTLQSPVNGTLTTIPGLYQVVTTLTSDGDYTPELYRAQVHIPATQPDAPELIWDSQTEGARDTANSGNGIIDVLLRDDARRSRSVDVHLSNAFNNANLPRVLGGLAADIYLYDRQNEEDVYLLKQGRTIGTSQPDQRDFSAMPDVECGGELTISAVGVESFLDVEITARLIGDGVYPNDYIRQLCIDGGLVDAEISGIGEGDIGIPAIERGEVGGAPAVQPAEGAHYWTWIQDVADRHCPGWDLYNNGTSLQLVSNAGRDKPALAYDIPPNVSVDSHLCIRGDGDPPRAYQMLEGYVTKVIVTGAKNAITGEPYKGVESYPQADDIRKKDSAFYTGIEITEVMPVDTSLNSDKACQLAARRKLGVNPVTPQGRTSWYYDFPIDFDPNVFAGDVPRIYGKKAMVSQVTFGALAAGGSDMERMHLTVQLAEDWEA